MTPRLTWVLTVLIAILLLKAIPSRAETFGDLYFETVYLNNAKILSGLVHGRLGKRLESDPSLEVYAVARLGEDIRTQMAQKTQRLSNPLVFGGVGVDKVIFNWGVRLTAQAGASYQKNTVNQDTQFDFRTGALGYWEKNFFPREGLENWLRYESYAEALYLHRLRSVFVTPQFRLYSPLLSVPVSGQSITAGPLALLVPSGTWNFNQPSADFSGWTEFRAGARVEKRTASFLIQLNPFYVFGRHFEKSPHRGLTYQEFRLLLVGYFSW